MEVPTNKVTYRTHRPGDIGYITYRHGVLYCGEYGYSPTFESLVARIGADFLDNFNPDKEQCWVAEKDGEFMGCIMLVNDDKEHGKTAKIRLLLVEQKARGLGLGRGLAQRALDFAESSGYEKVVLFTQSALLPARELYQSLGFQLIKAMEEEGLVLNSHGEMWQLNLQPKEEPSYK